MAVKPELVTPTLVPGKATGLGAIEMEGTVGATPFPVKAIGTFTAPADTVNVPVSAASSVGVNVTFTVQEPAGARTVPLAHVPVAVLVKSAALAPVSV